MIKIRSMSDVMSVKTFAINTNIVKISLGYHRLPHDA